MKLLLDIGNTRCKWGVESAGDLTSYGVFELTCNSDLVLLLAGNIKRVGFDLGMFSDICLSSVRGESQCREWEKDFAQYSEAKCWVARVESSFSGFHIAYKDASHLGVDRWLAMLAAKNYAKGASIVIDAGSAITVDYINEQGQHNGGLIVPGLSMMTRSLFSETHGVKVAQLEIEKDWEPGEDTLPCVAHGLCAVLKGFLAQVQQKSDSQVIVTGGDASTISKLISGKHKVVEHLVLEGLLLVIPS